MQSRWTWRLLALPGVAWLSIFFIVAFYAVVAVAFGNQDSFSQPVPFWEPWEWNVGYVLQVLRDIGNGGHFLTVFLRTFAFVAELVEITDLFADHPVEHALGLVFGGDVLDVDANSDYGAAFGAFHEDFSSAVTRRTTVLVLGDGRGNGNDPNLSAFEEITRRARETIWLTPEPRYSWGLGGCDLPLYAEYCSRVRVVRDLTGLETAATDLATELVGR